MNEHRPSFQLRWRDVAGAVFSSVLAIVFASAFTVAIGAMLSAVGTDLR